MLAAYSPPWCDFPWRSIYRRKNLGRWRHWNRIAQSKSPLLTMFTAGRRKFTPPRLVIERDPLYARPWKCLPTRRTSTPMRLNGCCGRWSENGSWRTMSWLRSEWLMILGGVVRRSKIILRDLSTRWAAMSNGVKQRCGTVMLASLFCVVDWGVFVCIFRLFRGKRRVRMCRSQWQLSVASASSHSMMMFM